MHTRCRAHTVVSVVAVLAWLVIVALVFVAPDPDAGLRLPFFAVLGVATVSTNQALTPLIMRRFVKDTTLAYFAGYHHREEDDSARRHLRVV